MTCGNWGCILFESKEYIPRPPKKDFGGIANFPPVPPLKRPKAGGCGPLLWNPAPGGGRGYGYGGSTLGAFGRTVGGGLCPAPGWGRGTKGRGYGFPRRCTPRNDREAGISSLILCHCEEARRGAAAIRSLVGGLGVGSVSGRPHRAAPTQCRGAGKRGCSLRQSDSGAIAANAASRRGG